MKQELLQRAKQYASLTTEDALLRHEVRAKSPLLFVILGNKVQESIGPIKAHLSRHIMNAEGAIYLAVDSEKGLEEENVISLSLPLSCLEQEKNRGKIPGQLLQGENLKLINEELLEVRSAILSKSKMFHYWEQLNIVCVTAGSEPINILLPDLMTLLRRKLEQDFKQFSTDLFVLVEEASQKATPLNQAITLSLFEELEAYQKDSYCYEKETEYIDENLIMKVHYEGAIFQNAFILSDKRENGQKLEKATENHYETIAAVSLLKNKEQRDLDLVEAKEQYNNSVFMNNVKYQGEMRYCSANLSKVKKPGTGIYLAVSYHLFRSYIKDIQESSTAEISVLLDEVGLSENKLMKIVQNSMPSEAGLQEIQSVISNAAAFKELKGMTFKEAEQLLYGSSLEEFFSDNFSKLSKENLGCTINLARMKREIEQKVICNVNLGPYVIQKLFEEEAIEAVEKLREHYVYEGKGLLDQIEDKRNQLVGERIGSKMGFLDKKYLREVKEYLIREVYALKYKWLMSKLKLEAIDELKDSLELIYEEIKEGIKALESLGTLLKGLMEESNKYEEAYLIQNVNEYYEKIVGLKVEQLEKNRGAHFLQEEKFMGPAYICIKQQSAQILEKLFTVVEKYILQDEKLFGMPFEEELLARANMLINYEEKEVVAKSDLYNMLYLSLEDNSKPCVFLDTATVDHRYEEKYFFGQRESEFMDYAYQRDQSTRNYKLAYINDARKSGIEKLQLMGGFKLCDLIFTTSAKRYYEAYLKEGYVFHQP